MVNIQHHNELDLNHILHKLTYEPMAKLATTSQISDPTTIVKPRIPQDIEKNYKTRLSRLF